MPKFGGKACSCLPMLRTFLVLAIFVGGCAHHAQTDLSEIQSHWSGPATRGLTRPFYDSDVLAACCPPLGWKAEALKSSSDHTHQVWLSPTGMTAYGVIHFKLPLPVGENLALSGFMNRMKQREGWANLLSREDDPNLPGVRFVAEGGIYKLRGNMVLATWEGWVTYAGTRHNQTIVAKELDLAVRARDLTKVGEAVSSDH